MTITAFMFDKGYNDYKAFQNFTNHGTGFVTRIKNNADYKEIEALEVEDFINSGVLQDDIIEVAVKGRDNDTRLKLRKVRF